MNEHFLLIIFSVICLAKLFIYCWDRRKLYFLAWKFPGPFSLPIIGCTYRFMFVKTDDLFQILIGMIKSCKGPVMKFWMGPELMLVFKKPSHVEKLLSTTKLLQKPNSYEFLKPFAGDGLISGSGVQWKVARRHCQPLFGQKFVTESIGISNKHINRFMDKLILKVDQPKFCIHHSIHLCVADIIGESILGTELGAQKGRSKEFIDAMVDFYDVVYERITKPWYQIDLIYDMTELRRKTDFIRKIMRTQMDTVAENVRRMKKNDRCVIIDQFKPTINDLDTIFKENSKFLDYKTYIDNLITLYAASEDTIAQIAAATCFCLGMYPECQEKAAEEIKLLVGVNTTNVTYDDIMKLQYLDRCVKEALRLFPIAPFIMRKVTEELTIDKWTLPKNVTVLVSIFSLHFSEKSWEKPMEFYPEHFEEEAVSKRHPYAFVPFSAGPRGCIGKLYAQVSIKVMLVNILQRFKIHAEGKYEDVFKELKADISVRSKIGFPVKLTRRKW
ncbi:cytochrome P450 4C1 [Aethina tumida]|uniref:cytochrome P450 4C1 n=1 Tax=Aethina tumida TaxID=116153 RepID=UPI00214727AB|nr:cytochrome P450 4C1 [Aethina tumida]